MSSAIRYYSTNRRSPTVSLREALLQGQAPDRGLYMPERIPAFDAADLARLASQPYPEVAFEVLRRFSNGELDEARLAELCREAYDFDVPIERVTGRQHILRLDQGPTASFKDFAARMMARLMGEFNRGESRELIILTATSGDTGSAVAHAFHDVPGTSVVVVFPLGEVSDRQRKQMTTLGGNVAAIAIDGKFDDAQAMVKQAFTDPELSGVRLSSANSINIGRLLPQAVYYVYAALRVADAADPVVVSIPSGNFGNLMGAMIAWRMGAPIARIVAATNANDEVPSFLHTGRYEKVVPSRVCISNAMNVGHPSNLARLVDLYGGQMDETGRLVVMPDRAALGRDVFAASISDEETRATIREVRRTHGVLLEPHGAVGWAGLERLLGESEAGERCSLVVETAHPAKFPEELRAILGIDPPLPPSLAGLDDRPEQFERIRTDYGAFQTYLRNRFL